MGSGKMDRISVTLDSSPEKISKVRWLSKNNENSTQFITGSYDESNENSVSIRSWCGDEEASRLLCSALQLGAVTDLLLLTADTVISTSSSGDFHVFHHDALHHELKEVHTQRALHRLGNQKTTSCNGASSNRTGLVAFVGDDGVVNIVEASGKFSVISSFEADLASITAVHFIDHSTIACTNSVSKLKLYDVRLKHNRLPTPEKQYSLNTLERLNCLEQHPGQPHVLLVGTSAGHVCSFDTRMPKGPLCVLGGDGEDVWQVLFHPLLPESIFSCSQAGSLLHRKPHTSSARESWVVNEADAKKALTRDLMEGNTDSINCFDVVDNMLVCGTDNFQLCLFQGLNVC